jgi:hypothetical protein
MYDQAEAPTEASKLQDPKNSAAQKVARLFIFPPN